MLEISGKDKFLVITLANLAKTHLADLIDLVKDENKTDEDKISDLAGMIIMLTGAIKRIDEILMPVQFEAQSSHTSPIWRRFPKHELN